MKTKILSIVLLGMSAAAAIFAVDVPSTPFPRCPPPKLINISKFPSQRDANPNIRMKFNQSSVGALQMDDGTNMIRVQYLRVPDYSQGGNLPWIDTGITSVVYRTSSPLKSISIGARIGFSMPGVTQRDDPLFGAYENYNSPHNFAAFLGVSRGTMSDTLGLTAAYSTNITQLSYSTDIDSVGLILASVNFKNSREMGLHTSSAYLKDFEVEGGVIHVAHISPVTSRRTPINIHSFQVSRGTNVIMALVPVRIGKRGHENEGAMLDLKTGAIYRNAASAPTVPFECGPDL